jgi:N-acetylmuramoyl-L-alanine amidase/CHU_C Type IX secretion signal domain
VAATLAGIRRLAVIPLALVAAFVLAPSALASGNAARSHEVALEPGRASAGGKQFTLAGVRWQGTGKVVFRTRSVSGRWSAWRAAAAEDEDGPDPGSREATRRAGWQVGSPWWVGPSDRIETRTTGGVTRVRAQLVWSMAAAKPVRALSATDAPPIVSRAGWGANEAIKRGQPRYADAVKFTFIHHTAGTNGYSRAQAPAIVKGIQLFHVQSNGWNDIGYNFLVDRFGTIYEGRFGGVDRNVIGAHVAGFNTGSVGIALLGTHGSTQPSKAALDAIATLVAWRMDVAHADPTAKTTMGSVTFRNVSGHRDGGSTTCPGNALYAKLGGLATTARSIGLPKIFEPRIDESESTFRFRARLSSAAPWTVTIAGAGGVEVVRFDGTGSRVDWTWDAASVPGGRYTWTISSGSSRPASGPLRITRPPATLTVEATAPRLGVTPNGDGQNDTATLDYRLSSSASLTVEILDSSFALVATPVSGVWTGAGDKKLTIDTTSLPDGRYSVVLSASTALAFTSKTVLLSVSRSLGLVAAAPALFSPNGDGTNDSLELRFTLAAPATVRVQVFRDGRWVATPFPRKVYAAGSHRLVWNGRRGSSAVREGSYVAVLESTDLSGTVGAEVPFATDVTPPVVQILDSRKLRVRVSEACTLFLKINGRWRKQEVRKASVVNVATDAFAARVQATAEDAAGNRSKPVFVARTQR